MRTDDVYRLEQEALVCFVKQLMIRKAETDTGYHVIDSVKDRFVSDKFIF